MDTDKTQIWPQRRRGHRGGGRREVASCSLLVAGWPKPKPNVGLAIGLVWFDWVGLTWTRLDYNIYDIRYTIYEQVGSRELFSRMTTRGQLVGTKFHRAIYLKITC